MKLKWWQVILMDIAVGAVVLLTIFVVAENAFRNRTIGLMNGENGGIHYYAANGAIYIFIYVLPVIFGIFTENPIINYICKRIGKRNEEGDEKRGLFFECIKRLFSSVLNIFIFCGLNTLIVLAVIIIGGMLESRM